MTETQNTPNHRAPLAPGEIRTHTVGRRTFRVMHVAGGSFTQASYRDTGGFATVIATKRFAHNAVSAYADAIEQAESDAIDALDDADGMSFTAAGAFVPNDTAADRADIERAHAEARVENLVRSRHTGQLASYGDRAFADAVRRMCYAFGVDAAPYLAMLDGPDPMDDENLPMGASRTLVTGEAPAAPSLTGDVAALRSMIEQQGKLGRQPSQADMLATCDRIAASLPQRATATGLDLPLWLHVTCGGTATGHTVPKLTVCRKCDVLTGEADWQALYTLGGE